MQKCPEEIVEKARHAVMRLDPVGCGAHDVKECLLVQLEVRGETDRDRRDAEVSRRDRRKSTPRGDATRPRWLRCARCEGVFVGATRSARRNGSTRATFDQRPLRGSTTTSSAASFETDWRRR